MATSSSSATIGLQFHGRSISLPSRLHDPNSIRIEDEIHKLKTLKASVINGETIHGCVLGLAELYNCAQELMESPSTQQALLRYQNGMVVEEALERSVDVLDSCEAIRDLFLMIKEQVQVLQSALRRRKNGDSTIETDVQAYLCFRKKLKKDISKNLRKLKHMESKNGSFSVLLDVDHHLGTVIRVLKEVTGITISIFRSLLIFISSPPSRTSKTITGWSLISKLMLSKSPSSSAAAAATVGGNQILSDVGCVDIALSSIRNNEDKSNNIQMVKRKLEKLDSTIEDLESGLESLFRQLVQSRVTLLNIFTHYIG